MGSQTCKAMSAPPAGSPYFFPRKSIASAAEWALARAPRISSELAGLAAGLSTANSVPSFNPTKEGELDSAMISKRFFSTAMIKSAANLR